MTAHSVLLPGEGDKFFLVGDQITVKLKSDASRETFAMIENYVAPQAGPPPHLHRREHECFVILEGELQMGFDQTLMTRSAGSVVFLPRGVPHVFKNATDRPARILVFAAPGGFDSFVADAGFSIDTIPLTTPREVRDSDIARLMAACSRHGVEMLPEHRFTQVAPPPAPEKSLWVLGHHVTLKLGADQTNNTLSAAEITSPPQGSFVPLHAHRAMDEVFYVLQGTFRFQIDGKEIDAPAGTTIHVPPGVFHGFGNVTSSPARLIDFHFPGGFEKFFEECGVTAVSTTTPPSMPAPDPDAIRALMDRHAMDLMK